jgi:preprotein translocase subunit YajC
MREATVNPQLANIALISVVFIAFYLLVLRPQQERARKTRERISALKPGDEIVTIGGIFATIVEAGDRLRVRLLDGTELELVPQAVGQVLPAEELDDSDDDVEPEDADGDADA